MAHGEPCPCFCTVCALRMGLCFSMVEKTKSRIIFCDVMMTWNSSFSVHKYRFTGTQSSLVDISFMAAFVLQWQSAVVVTGTA